jgi:transposase
MQAMKPYSNDPGRKIPVAYETGDYTQDEVAELFGLSNATIRNFLRRKRETGSTDALPRAFARTATLDSAEPNHLLKLARENDHATLAELCQLVEKKFKRAYPTLSCAACC